MVVFTVTGEFHLETLPYPAFLPHQLSISTQSPVALWWSQHHPPLSPLWILAALGATATVLAVTPWPYIKERLVPLRISLPPTSPPSYQPPDLLTNVLTYQTHILSKAPKDCLLALDSLPQTDTWLPLCLSVRTCSVLTFSKHSPPVLFERAAKSILCNPKSPDLNLLFPSKL